jgi:hypothetical protein
MFETEGRRDNSRLGRIREGEGEEEAGSREVVVVADTRGEEVVLCAVGSGEVSRESGGPALARVPGAPEVPGECLCPIVP